MLPIRLCVGDDSAELFLGRCLLADNQQRDGEKKGRSQNLHTGKWIF
jgi:hypothetical protein